MNKKLLLIGFLSFFCLFLIGCGQQAVWQTKDSKATSGTIVSTGQKNFSYEEIQKDPNKLSDLIIKLLKNKDFVTLGKYVHPELGVHFSSYGYLDSSDIVLQGENLQTAFTGNQQFDWGSYDGSGEPILMTFSGYYQKFVYDVDFASAPNVLVNQNITRGNMENNLTGVFADNYNIEYYFSGFDQQYQGMDWKSLKLVFVKNGEAWFLVAILHGQRTI